MGGARKKWVDSWESRLPEPSRDAADDNKPATTHQATTIGTINPITPSDATLNEEAANSSAVLVTNDSTRSVCDTMVQSGALRDKSNQQQHAAKCESPLPHERSTPKTPRIPQVTVVLKGKGQDEASPLTNTRPVMTPTPSVALNFTSPNYSPVSVKDVRGEDVEVPFFAPQDWNATRHTRPRRPEWESESPPSDGIWSEFDEDITHTEPGSLLHQYTTAWLKRVPLIRRNLLPAANGSVLPDHIIDAENGDFVEQIEAPYTKTRREIDHSNRTLHEKLCCQTSAHSAEERLRKLRIREQERREKEKKIEQAREARARADAEAKKKNPFLCREPGHLRPAQIEDMADVSRIYTEEICNGWRALDQAPLDDEEFREHFRFCQKEGIPFLVAMSGYRNPHVPVTEQKHRVLGFAFLDIASRGLFGSAASNGKHSGRLYLIVDSRVRYNRIATALLDRMLIITSRGYLGNESSYQWVNPRQDSAYHQEGRGSRQWRTLQLEIYLQNLGTEGETKRGQEYEWIQDWLKVEFKFFESSFTSAIHDNFCFDGIHGKASNLLGFKQPIFHLTVDKASWMKIRPQVQPPHVGIGIQEQLSKKYIEDLESRLATIEQDLRRSGVAKDDTVTEDASPSQENQAETAASACDSRSSAAGSEETTCRDAPPMPPLAVQRAFPSIDLQYWRGIAARRKDIRANTRFDKLQQQVFAPLFTGKPNQVFIGPVFDEIMAPFPFLDWVSFKTKLTGELSSFCHPSWRACVNAVLSMTVCFRAAKSAFAELQGDAWAYFKTAFALLPQLMVQGKDLEAVEAIATMAMFLRGTPDAQNLSFLVSSASRLYQMIGLRQNKVTGDSRSAADSQRPSQLLWALYSMDQELTFRHGLPPVLDVRHQVSHEVAGPSNLDTPMVKLFRKRTSLAVIQSRIHDILYSATAPDLEDPPFTPPIQSLTLDLQQWSSEMHMVIPDTVKKSPINELDLDLLVHVDDLYLARYHTIQMLYWPLRGLKDNTPTEAFEITLRSAAPALYTLSRTKCADAAQETLMLIGHFYSLPFPSLWSFLSYFVAAHLTLLATVLTRPTGLAAAGHLSAMEVFVRSLKLIIAENGFDIRRVTCACAGMTSLSRAAIKPAVTQGTSETEAGHLTEQAKNALDLLNQATSPMYIAQNWMSNMKNKDYDTSVALARVLGIPWDLDLRYGPLVPEPLMPETYAFGFEESKEYSMYRNA
ncbi:hypothetical protein E8E14_006017 [Neopestalotiopsis sp. 37M]|nr:hypothetical protein E8E14_006017 [Neopestalotiopsis sp. 37M]